MREVVSLCPIVVDEVNYRWTVISDQLVGEYAIVTRHSFEVDVATRDDCSIVANFTVQWPLSLLSV